MAVTAKQCNALVDYYEATYRAKYNKPSDTNRYAARWGFHSVLEGMSSVQAKAIIDYYFTTPSTRKHDLDWFFYNYHKLHKNLLESKDDAAHRAKLSEESKLRAEAWRKRGKQSITDN